MNLPDEIREYRKLKQELHQKERESLFSNEAFAIGMYQVVSGGLLVGGLSQWVAIQGVVGSRNLLFAVVMAAIGLITSLLAAQARHEYRMWNVKAAVSEDPNERKIRSEKAGRFLKLMRRCMWVSLICISLCVVSLIVGASG